MTRLLAIAAVMSGLIVLGAHDLAAGRYKTGIASVLLAIVNGMLLA